MLNEYLLVTSYILSYNKFEHIYDSILSVLNQDYPNIELIISDDASGNFPEVEIRDFIERNKKENIVDIKIITHKKNVGTVRNLNGALKAGSGEYFIGLSSDDLFYDSSVMSQIVELFKESNDEILCCRRLRCTEAELKPIRMMPNNIYLPIISKLNTPEKQFRAFAIGWYYEMASGSATYYTKKHFEKWGYFDESYTLWEDGPFYAQYTRSGNTIATFYDIISVKYREGGISNQRNPLMLDDYARFIDFECYKHLNRFNKLDQRFICFLYHRSNNHRIKSKIDKFIIFAKYVDIVFLKLGYRYFCSITSKLEELYGIRST